MSSWMKGGRPLVQCASEGSQSCSAATYVGPRYEKTMHDCSIVISPSNRPIRHVPATFSTLPMVPLYPKRQQQRQRRRGRRRRANPFHTLLGYGLWTAVVIAVSQGTSFGIVRLLTSPSMMIWMLTTISTSTLSTTTTMAVAGYKVEAVIGSTFRFPSLARKKNGLVNRRSVSPTSSTAFGVLRTRGGSSSSDDANYDDDDDEVGRMDLDKEPSKNPTRRKPFLSSFIRSLFEVNDSSYPSSNDAPWEHGGDEEEYVPPQPHTTAISSSSSSSSSTLSQSTGRGGALIKEKPTSLASASAPSRVRNPLQWLGSLDIGRVAPFADRLIPEDDEDFCAFQNNNNINDSPLDSQRAQPLSLKTSATKMAETVRASVKSVRRVWWINTWAQQFADHDEDDDVVDKKYLQDDVDGTVVEMDNELEFLSATNIPSEVSDNTSSEDDFEILEDDKNDEDISNDNREDEEESDDDDDDEDDDDDDTGNEDDTGAIAEGSRNESDLYDEDLEGNDTRSFIALNGTVMEDALTISDDTPYVNLPSRPMLTATNVTNDSTEESVYVSSGKWQVIDRVVSLGYADSHPIWRVSPRLRKFRKAAAKMTGLHGVLSGKPHVSSALKTSSSNDYLGSVRRRLTAIERARRNIERSSTAAANLTGHRNLLFWKHGDDIEEPEHRFGFFSKKSSTKNLAEKQRLNRVKEIDEQMQKAQLQLSQLAYEKDMLQRRPNPLWNYTMGGLPDPSKNETIPDAHFNGSITATRQFSFPPSDLVVEYLDMLFASGRLVRLNHTDLWRNGDSDDYEDELTSPMKRDDERRKKSANGDSGNWLLRNVIGSKLGETTETAAYKAVCAGLMSFLAKSISTLHGVNVMTYSDIRLWTEYAPALPTLSAGIIPGIGQNRNYAEEAFQDAMRRGAKKKRPNKRTDNFIQREAVIETLISQCQIAAPLLKLFPLAWQRAMLGNIVIMATAIISDFCEGIEFQILGHRLSLAFSPITEEDMMRGMVKDSYNNPSRINPELFEAAVRATADSVSENLNFLDRWHERALGSDLLRTQIATLIARLVLTLTDDALRGSRLDLWAVHAGGPRLMANLEYRAVPRSGE